MSPSSDITGEITRFISGTTYSDLPEEVRELSRREAVDSTAVMVAGAFETGVNLLAGYAEETSAGGNCTLAGRPTRVAAASAALVNATSAHVHDFDDTQVSPSPERIYGLMTHPSSCVWPAALAVAEECGASGAELLAAYTVGLEVACRLCDAISPFHYIRGYHTTGTINIFGATAAAAALLKLTPEQIRAALGIAASSSAGLRINFGTMSKSLHSGRAAEAGVFAAKIAARGFTAHPQALEEGGGFFKVVASGIRDTEAALSSNPLWGYAEVGDPGFDADRILGRMGNPFWLQDPGLSMKPYPSVVLSHPSISAMLDLVTRHDVDAADIKRIRVGAGKSVVHVLYRTPVTGTQGKFSVTFCLALAAKRRRVTLADFSDETVQDPELVDLVSKVDLVVDPDLDALGRQFIGSRIEVELTDGRVLTEVSGPYKGGPEAPFSEAELRQKFESCSVALLGEGRTGQAYGEVRNLDAVQDVRSLTALLRP